MLTTLRLFILAVAMFMPLAAFAQTQSEAAAQATAQPPAINEQAVKQLVETLESETARTELISNLKLLLDEQGKKNADEQALAPLTETLGVETFTGGLVAKYQKFLAKNNLKGSTVGKIGLTIAATLIMLGLVAGLRRSVTRGLKLIDKVFQKLDMPPLRLGFYGRIFRGFVTITLGGLLIYSYFIIWGSARNNPFETEWARTSLKIVFNVAFVFFLGLLIWEALNATLQVIFKKLSGDSSSRAQTLMPIVRKLLFMLFGLLFGLILLSELGINIMPLLAGAGIVGVAVGFGAQNMVKDFLTGFTILLEDVVRVGDVIKAAGHEGLVEKITLRKIQLRDSTGRVYTIPFGEIKTIENATKDFSFYPLDIGVSYNSDTDRVCEVMRQVDETMRADAAFAADILEPIEIFGVDKFTDNSVVIKARIKTQPLRQWVVGREYNRRLKKAFDTSGIEMPFPQRVVTIRNQTPEQQAPNAQIQAT